MAEGRHHHEARQRRALLIVHLEPSIVPQLLMDVRPNPARDQHQRMDKLGRGAGEVPRDDGPEGTAHDVYWTVAHRVDHGSCLSSIMFDISAIRLGVDEVEGHYSVDISQHRVKRPIGAFGRAASAVQ